jgi:hypothetical protein
LTISFAFEIDFRHVTRWAEIGQEKGEGRLKGAVAQPAVGAVLVAIGIGKQQAAMTLAKLKHAKAAPVESAPIGVLA